MIKTIYYLLIILTIVSCKNRQEVSKTIKSPIIEVELSSGKDQSSRVLISLYLNFLDYNKPIYFPEKILWNKCNKYRKFEETNILGSSSESLVFTEIRTNNNETFIAQKSPQMIIEPSEDFYIHCESMKNLKLFPYQKKVELDPFYTNWKILNKENKLSSFRIGVVLKSNEFQEEDLILYSDWLEEKDIVIS